MVFLTLRTSNYEQEGFEKGLRANLDLLEERRAKAHLNTLAYKKAMTRIYNCKVRPRPIKVRDLVLRKAEVSDLTRARGKLAPNWESPLSSLRRGLRRDLSTRDYGGKPPAESMKCDKSKKVLPVKK